jgi:two-component system nitrogen regulation sensor histidine kinase NtrY
LHNGIFSDVRIEQRFGPDVPLVRLDPEQIRRVIINLVDNAVEAMERRGSSSSRRSSIAATTSCGSSSPTTAPASGGRTGEALPAALPTKRRGKGLGLAIVRRVIAEHGGSIDVTDNHPHGTRFTIELPC